MPGKEIIMSPNKGQVLQRGDQEIITVPQRTGSVQVIYSDELYTELHEDGLQQLRSVVPDLSKAGIMDRLREAFETYGYSMTNAKAIGTMAKILYEDFAKLRFLDIDTAFKMHAAGRLQVDMKTYGDEITVRQVVTLMRAYRQHQDKVLQPYRDAYRRQREEMREQQVERVPAPESFRRRTMELSAQLEAQDQQRKMTSGRFAKMREQYQSALRSEEE